MAKTIDENGRMEELTSRRRKYLKGLAHSLQPIVRVGKQGITEGLQASFDEALEAHELIKIKFADHRERKDALCRELAEGSGGHWVATIGHVAIFYRPSKDASKRTIRLPESTP